MAAETSTWATPYREVLASRVRAQRSYPAGFALDLMGSLLIGLTEFGEVWVIFHNVASLGGLDFDAILVLFGLSNLAFSTADLVVGHLDTLPAYIRSGTLDAFYLRPLPVLSQLMTSEIDLRRISRIVVALVALVAGLARNDVALDPRNALLVAIAVVCGTAIFAGLFVCAASLQFFLINGAELTNAFTYGGSYASSQPASIFTRPMKLLFGYLVPVVFTAYLPTLALLDSAGPGWFPSWLAWLTPLAAAWVWLAAFVLWRWGTRHYQGGGG
jgi:viologen exporter family transport system permease protein